MLTQQTHLLRCQMVHTDVVKGHDNEQSRIDELPGDEVAVKCGQSQLIHFPVGRRNIGGYSRRLCPSSGTDPSGLNEVPQRSACPAC